MANMPALLREFMRLERMREAQGFSMADLERWGAIKQKLASHFGAKIPKGVADQRRSLRIPTRLRVSFESYGALQRCLMTNISRGGVFVSTAQPLPIGTPFELRIEIGETGETIAVRGEVASVNSGPKLSTRELGMGIRFVNLDEGQEKQIEELYGRAMSQALEAAE